MYLCFHVLGFKKKGDVRGSPERSAAVLWWWRFCSLTYLLRVFVFLPLNQEEVEMQKYWTATPLLVLAVAKGNERVVDLLLQVNV